MKQKITIVFIPFKLHLRFFLYSLSTKVRTVVLTPPGEYAKYTEGLVSLPIRYWEFGASFFTRRISADTRTLKYIPGLGKKLHKEQPHALVVFEGYHWYTLQSIFYRKRHTGCKLFLVNETKRWPQNKISKIIKKIFFWYIRRNNRYIDGMFVYTDEARMFLNTQLPEIKSVYLLPAPTNIKIFKSLPNKVFLKDDTLHLLMNARYAGYKRHKDLFTAIASLKESGKKVHLTCIGRAEVGKESIVNLVNQMGLKDSVTFRDPVSLEKMAALYHEHDVLVLPSYNEAIGMVVPEAMACGVPTITTDTVGANVYVIDGETGSIYPTGDIEALRECISNFFDVHTLQTYGRKASEHIRQTFAPEVVVENFLRNVSDHSISKKEKEKNNESNHLSTN